MNNLDELDRFIEKNADILVPEGKIHGEEGCYCKRCDTIFSPSDSKHHYGGRSCCTNCDSDDTRWVEFRRCPICKGVMVTTKTALGKKTNEFLCPTDGRLEIRKSDNELIQQFRMPLTKQQIRDRLRKRVLGWLSKNPRHPLAHAVYNWTGDRKVTYTDEGYYVMIKHINRNILNNTEYVDHDYTKQYQIISDTIVDWFEDDTIRGDYSNRPCSCGIEYVKQGKILWCPKCKGNFVEVDEVG
jgi:hypothetical protein